MCSTSRKSSLNEVYIRGHRSLIVDHRSDRGYIIASAVVGCRYFFDSLPISTREAPKEICCGNDMIEMSNDYP